MTEELQPQKLVSLIRALLSLRRSRERKRLEYERQLHGQAITHAAQIAKKAGAAMPDFDLLQNDKSFELEIIARNLKGALPKVRETLLGALPGSIRDEVKQRMVKFEDLMSADDLTVQDVLRRVNAKSVAVALVGAGEEMEQVVFRNLSKRAARVYRDELFYAKESEPADIEQARRTVANALFESQVARLPESDGAE